MLIKPFLQDNDGLYLDVYSHSENDFRQVRELLDNAGITPEAHDMDNPGKRHNKRFVFSPEDKTKFERYLRATIHKDRHRYLIEFDGEGESYTCEGIDENGERLDSVDFQAKDEQVAAIKSGLIANNNLWYDAQVKRRAKSDHSGKKTSVEK